MKHVLVIGGHVVFFAAIGLAAAWLLTADFDEPATESGEPVVLPRLWW